MFKTTHTKFMKSALALAKKGSGHVSPNPMVGAVIVRNGEIIHEGWHTAYGKSHAEIEALRLYKNSQEEDIMYVTLEPCSHYGKTPPCADAIIRSGIKKVVVAMLDPNPLVSGRGIMKLKQSGIDVIVGVCEEEAKRLNRPFIKHIVTKKPYTLAKWAMTLDGKMAADTGDSKWISSESSRTQVHAWRASYDAVLVGSGTVIRDNPRLNVRLCDGRNPIRIVVDSTGKTPLTSMVYQCADREKTILATTEKASKSYVNNLKELGVQVLITNAFDEHVNLEDLYIQLGNMGITSIFAECGPSLQGALFKAELIDEVAVFIAPKVVGGQKYVPVSSGLDLKTISDSIVFKEQSIRSFEEDICFCGVVKTCSQD